MFLQQGKSQRKQHLHTIAVEQMEIYMGFQKAGGFVHVNKKCRETVSRWGKAPCEGGVYECPVGSDNCGCKEKSIKPVKDFKTGAFGSGQKVIVAPGASSGSINSNSTNFKIKLL